MGELANPQTEDDSDLKERLLNAGLGMTEDDFDVWQSDLYVRAKPGVREWLKKNYEWWVNVTRFRSCRNGDPWFDVPFANEHFWRTRPRLS